LATISLRAIRAAALVAAATLAACAGAPNVASGSPTPSPAASPSASSPPAGYRVLFTASTNSSSQIFLYDSASSTPQQLVSLAAGPSPEAHFISSQKVAYVDSTSQPSSRIVSIDLSTRTSTTELTLNGIVPAFGYSHDGATLAYLLHGADGKASLHIRRAGQETTLNLNAIPGRGVGRDDELRLEFAPDDKYLLMVDTFVGNQGQAPETGQFLVLRAADNTVAFLPPAGVSANATMATWARHSDRLYYRDQVGVRTWDAGTTSVGTLATALHWYDPAPSPDDGFVAFTDIDAQFVPRVRLYDLGHNQAIATVTAPRSHPIFITADTIWYLEEQPCQSECLGGPSQASGKVLAYNLKTKSEAGLPFTDVHNLSQLAVLSR
jgi:Tol biopolymer transport system component